MKQTFGGKAKYLVDESLGVGVYQFIRYLGHNAKYGRNIGLGHRSDQDVFAKAWDEKRVILTHDNDFINDQEFPFHRNPGVIVLPGASGPAAIGLTDAIGSVLDLFGTFRYMFSHPKIVIASDNVWHVRDWDKQEGFINKKTWRFTTNKTYIWEDDEG